MTDQEEILIALGAVEQAIAKLQDELAHYGKLIEEIARGLGVSVAAS